MRIAVSAMIVLAMELFAQPAVAQTYPNRPLRIVVGAQPGGAGDIITRIVAQGLAPRLGQPVLVENRGGAGGNVGADVVAKAAPDGYTLLLGENGILAINPTLYPSLPFVPERDFVPISLVASFPFALVVNPSSSAGTVREFIDSARSSPAPLQFASPGTGTPQHLGAAIFAEMAGIRLEHIPYRGGAPATIDLLGGKVKSGFIGLPPLLPHMRAGALRILAVSGAKRSTAAPDIPTIAEAALPGFDAVVWLGYLAPAGTPAAIVQRLHAEIGRVLDEQETQRRFAEQGADLLRGTSEEFAAFIRAEGRKWSEAVRRTGATAN